MLTLQENYDHWSLAVLILFDMSFLTVSHGGGGYDESPIITLLLLLIMKFGTSMKFDAFYTIVTKS